MRIAFLTTSLDYVGPNIVVFEIINYIREKVDKVDIYFFKDSALFEDSSYYQYAQKIDFLNTFEFDKYDIIHSHGLRPDLYIRKFRDKIVAKCITTLHQYNYWNFRYLYNKNIVVSKLLESLWNLAIQKHDIIVTLTKCMRDYYRRFNILRKKQIVYIYNGATVKNGQVSTLDDQRIKMFKENSKVIGIVANLTKIKGIDQMVYVLKELEDYKLIIIGEGYYKEKLIRLSKRNGVYNRILFLGHRNQASKFMRYFDIYAQPSLFEGFSLSLIEAAVCKIPVICSDIDTFRELYDDDEVAFFQLYKTDSIVEAVRKLETNGCLFSEKLHKKYLNNFTGAKMGENYMKLYRSLLNS